MAEVNRDAVALMLRHNYIPAPYSIYESTYKLLPGTILSIDTADPGNASTPDPYWSVKQVAERGSAEFFSGSEDEAISHLDALLRDAVKLHTVSDVPLGAFLSGGVDSSTIVALMQAQSERPVKTFSIGFYEQGYNEAGYARAVADYLGTEHNELYVTSEQAMAVIPKMPALYDEPFSDCSQIPTFLVSELARRYVTVSLSGDGGDELFGGYNRYFKGWNIWRNIVRIPAGLRWVLAGAMTTFSPLARESLFFERMQKLAGIMAVDSPEAMYLCLLSQWRNPVEVVINATEPPTLFTERDAWVDLPDFTRRVMYLDTVTYLPDDILTKVDRASMGVSLEVRVPLLDHRVVEFTWRVPLGMKVKNGQGKWLLQRVLEQYVPGYLTKRPKMGFEVPIGNWLRGALKDWAEDLLSEARLSREGYFQPEPIRKLWKEHLSGKRDRWYYLWDVLMFQAWLDKEQKVKIIN
ncbi:MAG: asparagine synthase-related protein [Desulfotomaculaceae bacterium]|nr:asparagine synthase-related protein [Desulfotomaculaceae bacterium]